MREGQEKQNLERRFENLMMVMEGLVADLPGAALGDTRTASSHLACWGTYAYMHICTKSIQIYFGIFFDFILVLLSFHCSHTVPIFSEIFPIFLAILFTSKACHFDTALLILLPFKRPHFRMLCGIKLYHTQCLCSLRRAEQS